MPAPQPKDPLDDPIARFVTAVNEFLAMKADVDPLPKQPRTQNPIEDLMRNWEEFKRHIRSCHEAMVGAQPEAEERLQTIVSVGADEFFVCASISSFSFGMSSSDRAFIQ